MKSTNPGKTGVSRSEYKKLLLGKKADLLFRLGLKSNALTNVGRVNEEDLAQISHEEFISLRLNGIDYEKLKLVEEALDRLESGEHGICIGCEKPIAAKRLQALPWATYCVECQERFMAQGQEPTGALNTNPETVGV